MSLLLNPRLWIAVFSLAAVMLFALSSIERTSPGELTAVHGAAPDIAGGQRCSQCHGGWFETMTEACLACHEPIATQIDDGSGLHGRLGSERAGACASCHSEHHGPEFRIVNRQSFALAGVADPDRFDHAIVGFEMGGRHLELECAGCHARAEDDVLPAGEHRFLGLDQECASCHLDAHDGRMAIACADCHGQFSFQLLEPRDHERHLPLTGGHANVACAVCHEDSGPHALGAIGEGRGTESRRCADCHESPHDPGFTKRVASRRGAHPDAACAACHAADHASFLDSSAELTPALHALSGFTLDAPHDEVACAECHDSNTVDFAARHPGREPDDCRACHEDPHGGQFDGGSREGRDCLDCHERHRFEPHSFTAEAHARAGFELAGAHLEIECGACHGSPSDGAPRIFRGTPARCEACHADAHVGAFEAVLEADRGVEGGTCALCHDVESFSEVDEGRFDHGHWTEFGIEGAHAQTDCETCHPRGLEPDRFGRTFGRVREHFGELRGCETCHTDPHLGHFQNSNLPAQVDGRAGCARCHSATSFRMLRDEFDHGVWTGYPLVGAHRDARCTACHRALRRPDPDGRTTQPARGKSCQDCHVDPHGGQFAVSERTDCARCHRSAGASFRELAFDHDTQSRFPLGDAHRSVACDACHGTFDHDGRQLVRYRPLKRECADCHGTIRDPLRRGEGRRR